MKTYTHLKFEERFVIEKLWNAGTIIREIAVFLGRSPNTISHEIRRNSVKGTYTATKAEQKAHAKRWRAKRQCLNHQLFKCLFLVGVFVPKGIGYSFLITFGSKLLATVIALVSLDTILSTFLFGPH